MFLTLTEFKNEFGGLAKDRDPLFFLFYVMRRYQFAHMHSVSRSICYNLTYPDPFQMKA